MIRLLALLVAIASAAPSRAQVPSPHAVDVPRWFSDTFLEIREDVREAAVLDYVASQAYRKEPSFQRYLQSRVERIRRRDDKVDLWN